MPLNNEALDAIATDSLLTPEESANVDTVVIPGWGIIHNFAFHPDRLETHAEEIHQMLLELGPSYLAFDDHRPECQGGDSFLNMCMTSGGTQWTGMHMQQEKLYALGIASGWAVCTLPKEFWPLLNGGMPYLTVLHERKEVTERSTVGQMLEAANASSLTGDTVRVATARCMFCGEQGEVIMPKDAYLKYQAGAHIQQAWPQGSAGDREQIINGTHSACFDKAFPEED